MFRFTMLCFVVLGLFSCEFLLTLGYLRSYRKYDVYSFECKEFYSLLEEFEMAKMQADDTRPEKNDGSNQMTMTELRRKIELHRKEDMCTQNWIDNLKTDVSLYYDDNLTKFAYFLLMVGLSSLLALSIQLNLDEFIPSEESRKKSLKIQMYNYRNFILAWHEYNPLMPHPRKTGG